MNEEKTPATDKAIHVFKDARLEHLQELLSKKDKIIQDKARKAVNAQSKNERLEKQLQEKDAEIEQLSNFLKSKNEDIDFYQ